jgi:hypothetical protein
MTPLSTDTDASALQLHLKDPESSRPDLALCLEDLQSTISLSPSSRSARRTSSTHCQYAYNIRDRQRDPCDALLHFLRFLRFLRKDFSVKTSDGSRWRDQAKDAPAQSKSSNRLPSLCSTQPHIDGLFAQVLTPMRRETCVPGTW